MHYQPHPAPLHPEAALSASRFHPVSHSALTASWYPEVGPAEKKILDHPERK